MIEEKLLTVSELAKVLRVPKSWVYLQTRKKGPEAIPRIRAGKYIRFHEDEVLLWLRKMYS